MLISRGWGCEIFRKLVLNNETKDDCCVIDPWSVGWDCVWLRGVFAVGAGGEAGQAGAFFGADAGWRHVYGKRSGGEGSDAARKILDEAGFEGTTLLAGDGDYKALCDAVQATPTTLFADASGKLVGKTIVGEPDDLENTLLAAINKELKHAGKEEIALAE